MILVPCETDASMEIVSHYVVAPVVKSRWKLLAFQHCQLRDTLLFVDVLSFLLVCKVEFLL